MKKSSSSSSASFFPPLFDRLTLEDPGLLDEEGLKASIQKEISLMLNTRSVLQNTAISADGLEYRYSFPDLFGLQDVPPFAATNAQDWPLIERHMTFSLQAFEPRLKNPSVKIHGFDPKKQEISLAISGQVVLGKKVESISFPLDVGVQRDA